MPPPPDFDPAVPRHDAHASLPAMAEDDDLALGWECATPALQIEGWGERDSGAATEFH